MLDFDKKARTVDCNSRHDSCQNDNRGHQMGQKEESHQRETKTYTDREICCPLFN